MTTQPSYTVRLTDPGTRERDVQIKMTQNSRGFVLVNADQLSSQTDHARAAFSGIVAATLSRKARRRVRSDARFPCTTTLDVETELHHVPRVVTISEQRE